MTGSLHANVAAPFTVEIAIVKARKAEDGWNYGTRGNLPWPTPSIDHTSVMGHHHRREIVIDVAVQELLPFHHPSLSCYRSSPA